MEFKNPEQLVAFHTEWCQAALLTRQQLAWQVGVGQCYTIGAQWIQSGRSLLPLVGDDRSVRWPTNFNPDSSNLRVTVNKVAKYVQKEAAATHPERIEIEGVPSSADVSLDGSVKAQVFEDLSACAMDAAGFIRAAQDANYMRSVAGTWGIGFYISKTIRKTDGVEIPDKCVRAFDFDPVRLVLDPAVKARRLCDHEVVVYEDVWTLSKLERTLGVKLNPDNMPTIGQLTAVEQEINQLSQNQLYVHYRAHSKTKGTRVAQVHVKTNDGHFGLCYYLYWNESREWKAVNFEDPSTPFGGNGLPLALLHGHRRPGAAWSVAAAQMNKDDQDRLNMVASLFYRQIQKHAGFFWSVDARNFPSTMDERQISDKFTNQVGNVLVYQTRADKGVPPPTLHSFPAPQPFIPDTMQQIDDDMRENVARSEGNFGVTKTHVPDRSFQRALDESDQILGIRVTEDIQVYEDLNRVLVGTCVKHVKEEVPGALVALSRAGFGQEEFAVILGSDPSDIGVGLSVRRSSVRHQPLSSKQQALDQALQLQAIDPTQYRIERAVLDTPLTAADGQMHSEITKAVRELTLGRPWQPLALGEYNGFALTQLRRALFDPRAKQNPAIRAAILQAIVDQMEAQAQEAAILSAGTESEQPSGQGGGQPQPVVGPTVATLGDVLAGVSGGGGQGVPG